MPRAPKLLLSSEEIHLSWKSAGSRQPERYFARGQIE